VVECIETHATPEARLVNRDATLPVGPAKRAGTTLRQHRIGGAATHATPPLIMLVTSHCPAQMLGAEVGATDPNVDLQGLKMSLLLPED